MIGTNVFDLKNDFHEVVNLWEKRNTSPSILFVWLAARVTIETLAIKSKWTLWNYLHLLYVYICLKIWIKLARVIAHSQWVIHVEKATVYICSTTYGITICQHENIIPNVKYSGGNIVTGGSAAFIIEGNMNIKVSYKIMLGWLSLNHRRC